MFRHISSKNTEIYDEVFKCLPSNNVLTFEDLKNYINYSCLSKTDPVLGKIKLKDNLLGFIVDYPLEFLSKEKNFYPTFDTTEGLLPKFMWT